MSGIKNINNSTSRMNMSLQNASLHQASSADISIHENP